MNVGDLLHILFLRWKLLVIPPVLSVFLTGSMLLFVQPEYVSVFKLWMKERHEESGLLRIERNGPQEDTHIKVQSEIIKSNRVLEKVVDEMDLATPSPSRSIISNKTGWKSEPEAPEDLTKATINAVKAMHKNVHTEIVNPEIMVVVVHMNDPTLAQKVAGSVAEAYREAYLEILFQEVDANETYLLSRQADLEEQIELKKDRLLEFERNFPDRFQGFSAATGGMESTVFAKDIADAGPVPLIMRQLALLEMEYNQVKVSAGKQSSELRRLESEISQNKKLLETYLVTMSEQARLVILHQDLEWRLQIAREAYETLSTELNQLQISRGIKLKETSSITVLDPPSFDAEQIYPRKKSTLIAAMVLGSMMGVALVYLAHIADPTFHTANQLAAHLGCTVLEFDISDPEEK